MVKWFKAGIVDVYKVWLMLVSPANLEGYKENKNTFDEVRYSILKAFFWVVFIILAAFLTSFLVGFLISNEFIIYVRIAGFCLIIWAVFGKVGWSIQTWDGDTLPERINNTWFKLLYLFGAYLSMLSFFI